MFPRKIFSSFRGYAALLFSMLLICPALAGPADSNFCVLGESVAGVGQIYYQHNELIIAEFREMKRALDFAKFRKTGDADRIERRLEAVTKADPMIHRKLLPAIMEPPTLSDHYHSCDRFKNPPVSGEYPIVYGSISPRLVGDMCSEEPEFLFEISPHRPIVIGARGVTIELQDFYDPDLSAKTPISYANLEHRANRGDRLAALLRGIMGLRMMQCSELPAAIKFTAVMEGAPIMDASLLFLDGGIQLIPRNDETARSLADAQRRASEQYKRRLKHASNWEKRAAAGAAVIVSGMAIMMMSRCNDSGSYHPYLEDCE